MDISRTVDTNQQIVHFIVTGEITVDEVRAYLTRASADPSTQPEMPGLIDMRNATAKFGADEMLQIAESVKQSPKVVGKTKRALLVKTELMYGLYRMFASFARSGPTDFQVFRDEAAARTWLSGKDVDSDQISD